MKTSTLRLFICVDALALNEYIDYFDNNFYEHNDYNMYIDDKICTHNQTHRPLVNLVSSHSSFIADAIMIPLYKRSSLINNYYFSFKIDMHWIYIEEN